MLNLAENDCIRQKLRKAGNQSEKICGVIIYNNLQTMMQKSTQVNEEDGLFLSDPI